MKERYVKSLEFEGFKVFERFSVSCRERNILVGPNNSGKSTILDALRIAADVMRVGRHRRAELRDHDLDGVCPTHIMSPTQFSVDLRHCAHNYQEGLAKIHIRLSSGNSMKILMEGGGQVEAYLISDKPIQRSTKGFVRAFPVDTVVVPTLSPFEKDEMFYLDKTVERNQYTSLASRNFRNIWLRKTAEEFEEFADLISSAWDGIRVMPAELDKDGDNTYVRMYYREGPNVREIQWSGFGFQVWMQMMTHIMRATSESTLVLDEPDIYLHPDLQHKLLSSLHSRVGQIFIATHSSEIINEVDPGDVLSISGDRQTAKRVRTEKDYSEVFAILGSSENAEFSRLARARRVLFFEGKDRKIFRKVAERVGKLDVVSDTQTAYLETEGFGQWERVKNAAWLVDQLFSIDVKVAAIFDRDFRSDEEVENFLTSMREKKFSLLGVAGERNGESFDFISGNKTNCI